MKGKKGSDILKELTKKDCLVLSVQVSIVS